MNLWQALHQIRYRLRARAWSGSGTLIFPSGAVQVTQFRAEQVLGAMGGRLPAALIRVGSGTPDPDHGQAPDYLRRDVAVTLIAGVAGDRVGSTPLLGAHRQGATDSRGRGLFEIEEEVLDELALMGRVDGISIQHILSTIPEPDILEDEPSAVAGNYAFSVWVASSREYPPASGFAAADAGSGNASLSWTLPPARFDRHSMILRRASGSTAPATVGAGTGVTLASDLETSVTDSPGAGTWSYALFAAYDEDGDDSPDQYSAAVVRTVVVT